MEQSTFELERTVTLMDLDENLRGICKTKTSNRRIGFSSEEFNGLLKEGANLNTLLHERILAKLKSDMEGKCIGDGYVLPDSITLKRRGNIHFPHEALQLFYSMEITFEYIVCNPNPSTILTCDVVSKNKIGILGRLSSKYSPLIVLVPNDLSNNIAMAENVDTHMQVEIIGKKFEQNDKKITVVAKLVT